MAEYKMPESDALKNNSNKARKERAAEATTPPAKNAITSGKMRKASLWMKFADTFFNGTLADAKKYLIYDVAIPQVQNAVIKAMEVMFYGGVGGSSALGRSNGNVPYNSYYVGRDGAKRVASSPASSGASRNSGGSSGELVKLKRVYDPRLITVEDRGVAERVLNELRNECNQYGQVSVQRLFSLVDIESDWSSTSYGWVKNDLDRARVMRCADGWCFDVPDPYPID